MRAKPGEQDQLPKEKRSFANNAGDHQGADVARGAPGILSGQSGGFTHAYSHQSGFGLPHSYRKRNVAWSAKRLVGAFIVYTKWTLYALRRGKNKCARKGESTRDVRRHWL